MLSTNNYSHLLKKIDEFIRKYYLNEVVRGIIYLFGSLFASYLIVTLAEYYGHFDPLIRTGLFYGFLLINGVILVKWIIVPFFLLYKLGKQISYEQASEIIGEHFYTIKDKLLNTLQLKKLSEDNPQQRLLIDASIDQKINDLKPVLFTAAIKLKDNNKYLKYSLPPLAIILIITITAPSIFLESTERLYKHDKVFVKIAPFDFIVMNKTLSAVQGSDFKLQIKMSGDEIPQDIYLEDGPNTFKLDKKNILNFEYTFRNIQENKKIYLTAGGFKSQSYSIDIKRRPSLLKADVLLEYPPYLKKNNEKISNSGDLSIPAGTKTSWKFSTENANSLKLKLFDKDHTIKAGPENEFKFSFIALLSNVLSVKPLNSETPAPGYLSYNIKVIPDLNPSIFITEKPDSLNTQIIYFIGQVSDDYGFSSLKFHYKIVDGTKTATATSQTIPIDKSERQNSFFYAWHVSDMKGAAGQQIEYFFEVKDNDGVNGPKASRSPVKTFKLPTLSESEKQIEKSSASVQKKLEQAIQQAGQLEMQAKKLAENLINKKILSFEDKKQIEQLIEKKKMLEDIINDAKQENVKKQLQQQNILNSPEEIIAKQKQIENLLENVLDEKTKDLLKKIEQLLEQNNKNQTQDELSNMQIDNKTLRKELDRILELYKQLEFDQKLSGIINNLKNQAEKQDELGAKADRSQNPEGLKDAQNQLNKDFDKARNGIKELSELNDKLEQKNPLENTDNLQELVKKLQSEISNHLDNKNIKEATQNQREAAKQLQALAQKVEDSKNENETSAMQINMQGLRKILSNLLTSSFEQEAIMQNSKLISANDPNYLIISKKQKDIKDNLKIVQDSLYSLSRKVPQIESIVNKEIQTINTNIDFALEQLAERRTPEANRSQQYAMTSINNLALMLSEVEDQMQKAMKNAKQGHGTKKGLGLRELSKMQEALNQNMQKAREQIQKQSQQPSGSKGIMSEQFARMMREQQLIRKALQDINREINKDGKSSLGNIETLVKEMEQTETDLVNKKIKQETIQRQQEILTKLLAADKAERERDLDTQRESKQGINQSPSYKIVYDEFNKIKQKELELLKTVPPALNSFYKSKAGDYFRILNTK